MTDKKRFPRIKTPVGVAVFPALIKPDFKFNAAGEFKTDLKFTAGSDEVLALQAKLEEIRDAFFESLAPAKRKTHKVVPVFKPELDKETGEETGFVLFRFKQQATVTKKDGTVFHFRPNIWDAANNKIVGAALAKLQLWGGSKLAIRAEVRPYANAKTMEVGVSLKPCDIQIVELVAGGGSPFATVEGGYKAEAHPDQEREDDPQDTSSNEDDDIPY